jgi:hypothetical protein
MLCDRNRGYSMLCDENRGYSMLCDENRGYSMLCDENRGYSMLCDGYGIHFTSETGFQFFLHKCKAKGSK